MLCIVWFWTDIDPLTPYLAGSSRDVLAARCLSLGGTDSIFGRFAYLGMPKWRVPMGSGGNLTGDAGEATDRGDYGRSELRKESCSRPR
jgi:hypothetical protein